MKIINHAIFAHPHSEAGYRPVLSEIYRGLIDARSARRLLMEGTSFDLWLQFLATDFLMRWNIDYFCESPIPLWEGEQPPQRMRGSVLFTTRLMEKIAAQPVYSHELCDFAQVEKSRELFHQYQTAMKAPSSSVAENFHPQLSK